MNDYLDPTDYCAYCGDWVGGGQGICEDCWQFRYILSQQQKPTPTPAPTAFCPSCGCKLKGIKGMSGCPACGGFQE